jgi:hypothetical protein
LNSDEVARAFEGLAAVRRCPVNRREAAGQLGMRTMSIMLSNRLASFSVNAACTYWDDINAGGVLAFPQPNIAAAVKQIDQSRRDLLALHLGLKNSIETRAHRGRTESRSRRIDRGKHGPTQQD